MITEILRSRGYRLECSYERGKNMKNKGLDCLALTIAIIGAINWGLIGLFSFDLVAFVFGNMSWFSRIIYALVGIAGLYIITFYMYTGGETGKVDS